MASFYATYNRVSTRGGQVIADVMDGADAEGMTVLTTSGTAGTVQRSGSDWTAPAGGYVRMYCDGAVWVHIDDTPTAAASTDHYLPASSFLELGVLEGNKISVIDA